MAVCALALTLTALKASADQTATAAKPEKTYTGTVKAVDPNGRTLDVKGFMLSKKFNLGDNCAYALWNKPAGAIGDLRPGEKVTVAYQDAHGVLVADNVKQVPMTREGMVKSIDPAAHTMTVHVGAMDKQFQHRRRLRRRAAKWQIRHVCRHSNRQSGDGDIRNPERRINRKANCADEHRVHRHTDGD